MELSVGTYLVGALMLAFVIGASFAAAWVVVPRTTPALFGLPFALALFLWTTAFVGLVHLLPGILGVLSRGTVVACSALLTIAAVVLARARPVARVTDREERADDGFGDAVEPPWARALAVAGVAAVTVVAVAFLIDRSTQLVTAIDALTTHLPLVARWIQTGSVWPIVQYTPDLSNGTYPENGTLMMLAAVLPWRSVFLVRYVDVAFLAALAVAIAAVGRELRAPWSAAALAGASVTTLAAINEPALEQAQVDAPMLAWFVIGSLFLMRAARTGRRSELVPAGLGLGLAFGTKWYAVIDVPVVMAAAAGVLLVAGARWRQLVRPSAVLVGIVALTGGFWLIRNWVKIGNPVHPAAVKAFGVTIFSAPVDTLREKAGFTVSDYLTNRDVWRDYFIPAYKANFGILGPILLVAIVVALVVGIVGWRRTRDRGRYASAVAVAAASLVMGLLYLKLPDTAFGLPGKPVLVGANARYLVPALLGGAVVLAWLAGRSRAACIAVDLVLVAGLVEGLFRSYHSISLRSAIAAVVIVGVAAAAAVLASRNRTRLRVAWAPVAAGVAVLVLFVVAGFAARHRTYGQTYASIDPTLAWVDSHEPVGARIALGKTWSNRGVSPVTPAFGPRLHNHVDYLGHFVQGTMRTWRDRAPLVDQVRRGNYDAVILGTGIPSRPGGQKPEADWLRALGYRQVAASERLVLLARRGN